MTTRINIIASLLIVFTFAAYSKADVIEYGDFDGINVTYVDVTESSLEDTALYGQPAAVGNTLDFPGTGFATESNNGEIDFLDGRLTLMVEADPGTTFNSITIEEFGAYFLFGEESIVSVSAIAFAETVDGIFDGEFEFVTTGSDTPQSGGWIETLTIFFPETDKVTLTLDNQLFTFADDPGVAFIDKKGINISVDAIPEPASAAILVMGLTALVIRRRR